MCRDIISGVENVHSLLFMWGAYKVIVKQPQEAREGLQKSVRSNWCCFHAAFPDRTLAAHLHTVLICRIKQNTPVEFDYITHWMDKTKKRELEL